MYELGIIGLGTMGYNMAKNFHKNQVAVSVYDIDPSKGETLVHELHTESVKSNNQLIELVNSLKSPKIIILVLPAGDKIDKVIDELIPFLSVNDIILDFGNSSHVDSIRRGRFLRNLGLHFIGAGVSGGEFGALNGASIMPSGDKEAYHVVEKYLSMIAAKDLEGNSCSYYMGKDGAGHFVKIVHNGIEYAEMQLIAEIYDLLRKTYKLDNKEISYIFKEVNKGRLESYLIDLTSKVLLKKDKNDKGSYLVDKVNDAAMQKGTGFMAGVAGLELGCVIPSLISAVIARNQSCDSDLRKSLSRTYVIEKRTYVLEDLINVIEECMYFSKLIYFAQGFSMIDKSNMSYQWDIDLNTVANVWKNGCILKSQLLYDIDMIDLAHEDFLLNPMIITKLRETYISAKKVLLDTIESHLFAPVLSSVINYWNGYQSETLPMNLVQSLRDAFGAHGFERIDDDGYFHEVWI